MRNYKQVTQTLPRILFFLLLITAILNSCKRPTHSQYPVVSPNKILNDPDNLVRYWNQYIKLDGDFQSFDTQSRPISNREFLKRLTSAKYLPLTLESGNDSMYYKLYSIDSTVSNDYGDMVASYSNGPYHDHLKQGKKFPDQQFSFTDLDGHSYNSQTTKGKILVIKFWFINCVNCIKEMPKLNELHRKFQNRKDVVFLSMAYDSPQKLRQFLTKTRFDIPVIHAQQNYIEQKLDVNSYPTIMVVDKERNIAAVYEGADQLNGMLTSLK